MEGIKIGQVIFNRHDSQELARKVDLLNACYPIGAGWRGTGATRDHVDAFGVPIRMGEMYYKRQYAQSFDSVFKLSVLSMERLLFLLTTGYGRFEKIMGVMQEIDGEDARAEMSKRWK
jgi:hypothetical protein